MAFMTPAQARENFFAAMETLRSSKVRSALTVLGIVIGVSSVISMAAIIQGLNKFVQDRVESLGSRTYFLTRFPPGTDPSHMPERFRSRRYLEYSYAEFVRAAAPDVENVTTVGTRGFFLGDSNLITSGDRSVEKVIVRGAEPEYIVALPLFNIERGRFISEFDEEHARPVVVLGASISESLFPNTDPLGETVRINGATYEVIGVFSHDQGLFLGPGVDIFAIIPMSNFRKQYPEAKELIMIFTVPKNVNVETAQAQVIQTMRRLRRVGGIGVMNIMLISVTERTQEIGVRKAIGARKADVRLQFLFEAVVLTLVGGMIGILIGAGVSTMVRTLVPSIPATLSYLWVSIGFAISVGVGVFFGYYPANLAANLDPIDCLRYE